MAIAIRLARGGMKKKPYYRIIVADSRNARDGKFIEKIGTYNPLLPKDSPDRIKLDTERAVHWLSVGAQPSDRVARFLDAAGVRTRAARANPTKGLPGEKAKERAKPEILTAKRKIRIARGAGTTVQEVNKVIKMQLEMASAMKKLRKMGGMKAMAAMMAKLGGANGPGGGMAGIAGLLGGQQMPPGFDKFTKR